MVVPDSEEQTSVSETIMDLIHSDSDLEWAYMVVPNSEEDTFVPETVMALIPSDSELELESSVVPYSEEETFVPETEMDLIPSGLELGLASTVVPVSNQHTIIPGMLVDSAGYLVSYDEMTDEMKRCYRMENGEHGQSDSKVKIIAIYSDFMTRITQFEELVSTGSRLLCGFQQALGFLGQPPLDKSSTLVDRIIKAHGSRRVLSYFEAGCINFLDSSQNVSKLRTCHLGLLDYINKGKIVIDGLECLLDDATSVVQIANEKDDVKCSSDSVVSISHEDEVPSNLSQPQDFATTMAIIYSMVKQDYTMQVQIVSSLNQKSSLGELETYCQMWSLRPFVDDVVMHRAWRFVPKP